MKKAEAISILATSVRPREAKDMARYDKAVKMAIEALNCSEFPNNSDTISRQAAIEALHMDTSIIPFKKAREYADATISEIRNRLEKLPSAEPKRGKWIRTGSGSLYDHYECSECGKAPKWECMGDNRWKIAFTDFCPNCGADMRQKGENNESN